MRAIVPVYELDRRLPEQGRIRMGIQTVGKGGKKYPKKLKRFRFTSADKHALDTIADKYGGEVTAWPEAPTAGQWQVTVTEARVPIILPPDPLSGSPIYEQWSGGGCIRRCDGVLVTLQRARDARPDAEPEVTDCLCRAEKMMQCKPTTRLNVVLLEVQFGGSWRLESHGWNVAQEMPGMVEMLLRVQQQGLTAGYLEIQERQAEQGAKEFIVPALGLPESVAALAAGEMKLAALGQVAEIREGLKAIEPPRSVKDIGKDWYDDEDDEGDGDSVDAPDGGVPPDSGPGVGGAGAATAEIEDAELVDEPPPAKKKRTVLSPKLKALHAGIGDLVKAAIIEDADTFRHALVVLITKGRTESSGQLDDDGLSVALNIVADLLAGDREYRGVGDKGQLRVTKARSE